MKNITRPMKDSFHVRPADVLKTLLIMSAAYLVCVILRTRANGTESYSAMLFILAVFMTARFTEGYVCGILASIIGVLLVNYIFTFPYFSFNFTLAGYPLTILCMLAVSLTTSALTTQTKRSEALKILAEKEKTRSNLLSAVSHDLRTPLTSILGATTAVIENDSILTGDERTALLRGAQDDAQWLIRMVENLLAVTRIDGESHAKIVKEPELAEEIAAEAVSKFKKRFPEMPVTVSVPDEFLLIPMDGVLIEQVIINLLENAVLHGQTLTHIDFSVIRMGNKAVFKVRDDGVGISPGKLSGIFDGCISESVEEEGDKKRNMGIGLSVCNTIIRAHGGIMRAKNIKGGGAEFQFELNIEEDPNGK